MIYKIECKWTTEETYPIERVSRVEEQQYGTREEYHHTSTYVSEREIKLFFGTDTLIFQDEKREPLEHIVSIESV